MPRNNVLARLSMKELATRYVNLTHDPNPGSDMIPKLYGRRELVDEMLRRDSEYIRYIKQAEEIHQMIHGGDDG